MRQVKSSRNKSTELNLIQFFKDNSIKGWRRSYNLFGRPDFVFPLTKKAVFVDGCFWHGHNCRNTKPKDNKDYWQQKISRNKKRDRAVTKTLKSNGWTVIRIWECQLKNERALRNKLTNKSA
ncbi:MAG: very short patch repair endonuclease [Chitinophagaceae bacterium]|nr:very short patch repair endonuclease [Chitinophagaceae bacterium]